MIKKIAILTSGGDAPGMNNAIRSITKYAKLNNIEVFFVLEGYKGLYEGNIIPSSKINLEESINKGGTIIYSARFVEFKKLKAREEAKKQLNKLNIDALVVIGGDGSYRGAQLLHEIGIKTIALPGTIDNDISSSDFTIGYDTALNTIVDSIVKIRDTSNSHNRAAIVEVMGHGCGDLALFAALATGAELVITNSNKMSIEEISKVIDEQINIKGKRSIIVIISEFIYDDLKSFEKIILEKVNIVTRVTSLGHIQRGGSPTAFERVNASLMGIKSVELLIEGKSGLAIGILKGKITSTPILQALSIPKNNRKELIKKINLINQI